MAYRFVVPTMMYAILCYDAEAVVGSWTPKAGVVSENLAIARLMPTTAATTLRNGKEAVVLDGPFAETKEQLLGFVVVECASLEVAIETTKELARTSSSSACYEIRPMLLFRSGSAL